MENLLSMLNPYKWTLISIVLLGIVYWGLSKLLYQRQKANKLSTLIRQVTLISLLIVGLLTILITIPFDDSNLRGQILTLISALLSAAIALNSATFIGNAFAGMMIRSGNHVNPGEFIRVENHFGLITEMSLFYVEIQRDDGGFTTLPNLFVAINPVEITRRKPIISSTVSLGYDVPRQQVQELLKKAAINTELENPYILIKELGDFSIVYSINGYLNNNKTQNEEETPIFVAQSRLNGQILDFLHKAKIEIVSPNFVNQRILKKETFRPDESTITSHKPEKGPTKKEVYDKGSLVKMQQAKKEELAKLQNQQNQDENQPSPKPSTKAEVEALKNEIEELQDKINQVDEGTDH